MMRRSLILFVLGVVVFAGGCENASEPDPYDVIVDSTVNSKLNEHRARLSARNDSVLKALETARADSLVRVGGYRPVAKHDSLPK